MTETSEFRPRDFFVCVDCGVDTLGTGEYYMVWDRVWNQAMADQSGMLCVGCLERRLGRKLVPDDFNESPLNWGGSPYPQSLRLQTRLYLTT
jgi:hypothetical protein